MLKVQAASPRYPSRDSGKNKRLKNNTGLEEADANGPTLNRLFAGCGLGPKRVLPGGWCAAIKVY
jgi:hypothetical protein